MYSHSKLNTCEEAQVYVSCIRQYISMQQYIDTFLMYRDTILCVLYRDTAGNVLTHKRNQGVFSGLYSHMKILWMKHFVIHSTVLKVTNSKSFYYTC